MIPLRPLHATRVLAEGQDEYHRLAIRDELMDGGSVRLTILGTAHPPVKVETEVRKWSS